MLQRPVDEPHTGQQEDEVGAELGRGELQRDAPVGPQLGRGELQRGARLRHGSQRGVPVGPQLGCG